MKRTFRFSVCVGLLVAGCGGSEFEDFDVMDDEAFDTPDEEISDELTMGGTISNGLVTLGVVAPPRGVDYNGDGRTDMALFRADTGAWAYRSPTKPGTEVVIHQLGHGNDYPVPADYDGDGRTDPGVFRLETGSWHIRGRQGVRFGEAGDIPVPADYNGDGRAELAVFRPRDRHWYFSSNRPPIVLGRAGDVPVPGDYYGDRKADPVVWRPQTGQWITFDRTLNQQRTLAVWGQFGDVPVPGDYNGDGKVDVAVWRPSTATWFVKNILTRTWGQASDIPVPGDYNGNGRVEPAVYRQATRTFRIPNLVGNVTFTTGGQPSVSTSAGIVTCSRPQGCTIRTQSTRNVLETVVRAHLRTGSIRPEDVLPWIKVGECEGGTPGDDTAIELALFRRGFKSPDRGPFQISPIHFFKGTRAQWDALRAAWTKKEPAENNDIALETDVDNYGFGYLWSEMLDSRLGAEFAVMLAARTQAIGVATNLSPWFKSTHCSGYTKTTIPIARDVFFPRPNDYAHYQEVANGYVKLR